MERGACERARTQWFALRVKPRSEKAVATMAHNKGFEEFVPLYECRRRWTDRIKSVHLPLFPGYVFCRLNAEHRLPLLTIPGVLHFVGVGKIPAPIEASEIATIQSAVQSGLGTAPWPFLALGQWVRLDGGPLAGLEGILIKINNQHRLVVSLSLLRRSVAVEIEREWVTPLDRGGRHVELPANKVLSPVSGAGAGADTGVGLATELGLRLSHRV
jgi:transcription antitermination factor NusG